MIKWTQGNKVDALAAHASLTLSILLGTCSKHMPEIKQTSCARN